MGFAVLGWQARSRPDLLPWYIRQHAMSVVAALTITALVCHLQLRLARFTSGGVEQAANRVIRLAAQCASAGVVLQAVLTVYMASSGGALRIEYHELLLGASNCLTLAGVVVVYGLSRAVRVLRTPVGQVPDQAVVTAAHLRLRRLSRVAAAAAVAGFGGVVYLDVYQPDAVSQFWHQSLCSLAAMPLIIAVISHEEARGPDLVRARRCVTVGGTLWGTLLAAQVVSGGAVGFRWQEYLLCAGSAVTIAGLLLRFGIYHMSRMVAALREMQRRIAEHTTRSER
ncbi:hypothetical protein R8Z50_15480 [Longispora sp. K20-0274]|uniref:hypothetical protein n=1 Tax=Longispora sp. K20-0274 TaxID=3088255 RepID=UPI00399BB93E